MASSSRATHSHGTKTNTNTNNSQAQNMRPFYAILHRIDVGIVIDLELARTEDLALSIAEVVQSQKLAVRAISLLQLLPGGDIKLLCDTVVESVRKLNGYDRVMVYKFHEDEHGEVVVESKRSDLEPYIGLHYPAMDIPQASRFSIKQNRVRMIVDCDAMPIRVIQDDKLMEPLCLVGSMAVGAIYCGEECAWLVQWIYLMAVVDDVYIMNMWFGFLMYVMHKSNLHNFTHKKAKA